MAWKFSGATLSLLLGVAGVAAAREQAVDVKDVPRAVQRSVAAAYPGVRPAAFAKEVEHGKTLYEVTFERDGHATEVSVAADGTIVSEEAQIAFGDLPDAVRRKFAASKFAKADVLRVEHVTQRGVHSYEVLVNAAGEQKELTFDARGRGLSVHEADSADEAKAVHDAD